MGYYGFPLFADFSPDGQYIVTLTNDGQGPGKNQAMVWQFKEDVIKGSDGIARVNPDKILSLPHSVSAIDDPTMCQYKFCRAAFSRDNRDVVIFAPGSSKPNSADNFRKNIVPIVYP